MWWNLKDVAGLIFYSKSHLISVEYCLQFVGVDSLTHQINCKCEVTDELLTHAAFFTGLKNTAMSPLLSSRTMYALAEKESYWKQWSKVRAVTEGDSKTAYHHAASPQPALICAATSFKSSTKMILLFTDHNSKMEVATRRFKNVLVSCPLPRILVFWS